MARDFNDMLRQEGGDAVRVQLDRARSHTMNGAAGRQDNSWGEPDLTIMSGRRHGDVVKLDLSLLGPLAAIVEAIAEYKGAPVDAAALALLTSASALIGVKRRAQPWSGFAEPTILWGGLVMAPSQNKSPVLDPFRDAVRAAEQALMADFDEQRRKFEAAKIAAESARTKWEKDVKEAIEKNYAVPPLPISAEPPQEPVSPRFWVGDITMEKAARLMAARPGGLLVYRDELAGWISGMGRYSGSSADRHFWKESHGGRPLRFDRVGGGEIEIPFAAASVLGALPPDSVTSLVLSGERDGFSARFDWVWPDPVRPKRPAGDDYRGVQDELNRIFRRLSTLRMDLDHFDKPLPRDLPLEAESANEFEAWRIARFVERGDATGLFADALGKQPGKLLRVASVLEHLWWAASSRNHEPSMISSDAVRQATRLVDEWSTPHLRRVLGEAAIPKSDHGAAALASFIMNGRPRQFNASTVRRNENLAGINTGREMDEACTELINSSWIRATGATTARGGAPRKDFDVNPRLFAR